MADVDLDAEKFEKYREAGQILKETMDAAAALVEPGASHLEVAEFAEAEIEDAGGEPAFPANISIDEEASHATPGRDEETVFEEGDLVCLDLGVHVDGWIADAAATIDLGDHADLVDAAEDALDAALAVAGPGVHTGEIGRAVEETIEEAGFNPVVNLSGHGLAEYDAHTGPTIPNRGVDTGVELEVGDVIAIEPFATDGRGTVSEGQKTEIYSLQNERSVRNRKARELLETVVERYDRLPFAARWFDGGRTDMTINRLTQQEVLQSYPVLKGEDGSLISQAEHTMIVTEDGVEITTN